MKQIIALLLISMLLIVACKTETAGNNGNINGNSDASDNTDDSENDNADVEASETDSKKDSPVSSKFKTISAAMSAGVPYKCTYTDKDITSEIVIKGEKFKSEARSSEGKFYSIMNGDYMYAWVDGEKEGTKFNIKEMEKLADARAYPGAERQQTLDVNREYDIDCSVTIATDSLFVPPSNVNFQDMSQIFKDMQETLGNLPNMDNLNIN